MSVDKVELPRELPPHPAPNMLNSFMTRYDYDYNRDFVSTGTGDGAKGEDDTAVSGEVRNRPIFCFGPAMPGSYGTIYRRDYVRHNRGVKDLPDLLRTACGEHDVASSFARDYYRPDFTKHNTADGAHPNTTYKTDYTLSGRVPKGEATLYAGARAAAFDPDFLLIPASEDLPRAEAELPPKITSKESLLPKVQTSRDNGDKDQKEDLFASRRPLLTIGGPPTDYYCTSWVYGDKSLAYPSQLPRGIEESLNAHLIGTMDDKAALLALLAGKRRPVGKPHPIYDDTNPIPILRSEQPYCAVTRRIDNEGHVKMSMYKSDFIRQGLLPELPDAVGLSGKEGAIENGDRHLACAGEMLAGTLTRYVKRLETLRNSHGNLLKEKPDTSVVDPHTWKQMKSLERRIKVDKADPHRHKLH
ncbi:uncharacterized protein TM35_002161010 [Trypanosoma theileri]|uniref:Uncharacterized protein n=1 Tax=Trypanosoma theileri TaxID=67003 RepID=A0A1X0ND00_9TRYP|nr:uncharacterized protein TM35_002161010 [Trypanosoma theileri]ORC79266.1 hypothetical protein TM35_002161010 [Trypanosoma theileri]